MIDGQWQEAQLRALPVERGVRLRGIEVSRLDTFVDAAFAFAVTLLMLLYLHAWSPLAGFGYWSLMISMPLQAFLLSRRRPARD